eukprot:2799015-Lingulodinium_polyedra.AAC.1
MAGSSIVQGRPGSILISSATHLLPAPVRERGATSQRRAYCARRATAMMRARQSRAAAKTAV